MEAPDKIYVHELSAMELTTPIKEYHIEYVRADAFIEKACVKLKKLMYDNLMFQGRLHREEVIDNFIANFKNYMKGE